MPFEATTALRKIAAKRARIRIFQGGTSAGKTIGIESCLIDTAQIKRNKMISVVSESFPHLKRGAIRDFLNIMENQGYYDDNQWNRTDSIYNFPQTNSKIEFFSADASDKVRGPRRDILFLNEANNISYETFTQLSIRTNDYIFIDYNPVSEFWVQQNILNNPELKEGIDYDFEILTYKDNEALPETIIREIESRRGNLNWYKVYGEGQLGVLEAQIYSDWAIIDSIPHEARLERYGLDFGYTNDPTAIVAIYRYNGGYILDEVCYQTGMSNRDIYDQFQNYPKALVKADSAEPKSIDELRELGLNILPAQKGPGSILQGIQLIQDQRISITKQSVNGIKESRNYMWETDRDGRIVNEPGAINNHLMDAARYGFEGLVRSNEPKVALFSGGDSVTGYGSKVVTLGGSVRKGYAGRYSGVRVYR